MFSWHNMNPATSCLYFPYDHLSKPSTLRPLSFPQLNYCCQGRVLVGFEAICSNEFWSVNISMQRNEHTMICATFQCIWTSRFKVICTLRTAMKSKMGTIAMETKRWKKNYFVFSPQFFRLIIINMLGAIYGSVRSVDRAARSIDFAYGRNHITIVIPRWRRHIIVYRPIGNLY